MDGKEIRQKFLTYFEKRGHTIVPSSSLIPDDPSVLLTTAGMQQFKPYYTGEADPKKNFGSQNTVSVQKSFRTSDIDEVGDESHLTFFEMLGNFSFGGPDASGKVGTSYWKKEAIEYAHEFITKEMSLDISYVSIFKGTKEIPKDEESKKIWKSLGITDIREEGMENVFWGPTGTSGPCGPTTEIYCKNTDGKDIEIWNIVFNEFFCAGSRDQLLGGTAKLSPLATKGVDTGMGLERLAMISQKTKTIFETDLFGSLMTFPPGLPERKQRIIADHARGITFLLADGVLPSNKGAGYILRRLMRRVMTYEKIDSIPVHIFDAMVHEVIHDYGEFYPKLSKRAEAIQKEIREERERFNSLLPAGLKKIDELINAKRQKNSVSEVKKDFGSKSEHYVNLISGKDAFEVYQSYGIPPDLLKEILALKGGYGYHEEEFKKVFDKEFEKHQEISRAGVEKKFGGHGLLLDTGELKAGSEEELKIVTRLHTATHLLNAALRKVLGETVEQRGSDITPERTRFDFLFPRKLTPEELAKVEKLVNYAIQKDFPMTIQEMNLEDAKKSGALFFYKGHYPPRVKVYTVKNESETFSRELCGGPHVTHTGEIGKFKIIKEEASSAGVRRIRAVIE